MNRLKLDSSILNHESVRALDCAETIAVGAPDQERVDAMNFPGDELLSYAGELLTKRLADVRIPSRLTYSELQVRRTTSSA